MNRSHPMYQTLQSIPEHQPSRLDQAKRNAGQEAIGEARFYGCKAFLIVVDSDGNQAVSTDIPRDETIELLRETLTNLIRERDEGHSQVRKISCG